MMKSLTVSEDYVRVALQRALDIDFSSGRCPTISLVAKVGNDYVLQFAQVEPTPIVAEPPIEIGDTTTRQRRRFAAEG